MNAEREKRHHMACAYDPTCTALVEDGEEICLRHRLRINTEIMTAVRRTTGTLISWMAQSGNSPIHREEAQRLLDMLAGGK